nr:hypothetical protein [Mycobacterium sp. 21AC1]
MRARQPFTSHWVLNPVGTVTGFIGVGMPLNVCFEKSMTRL